MQVKNTWSYVQPTLPSSGYSFVAAGSLWRSMAGYSIYVKYRSGSRKVRLKRSEPTYKWFECPDRELVIVRNSYDSNSFYPWGDSFDECVDLSLYNDSVSKSLGLDYIMTNFAHSPTSKTVRTTAITPPDSRIQVMSDSGGLQLIKGVKSLIHPIDLINFYNNNVDAGMVLDIPLHFDDPKLARQLAILQKKNTDIMLKYSKGVELINIFHGQTLQERKRFREIVEDPRMTRVAIARGGQMTPVTLANTICETIEGGLKYKQYHILGVYSSTHIPILVKLANSGEFPIHITSDSTSHIKSAFCKSYHHQFDIFGHMKRLPIGTRGAIHSAYRKLPCQCKVCKTIKYMDIMGFLLDTFTEPLAIHNAYEMSRYANQLQEVCINAGHTELNSLVGKQLIKNPKYYEVQRAFDFIDIYNKHGLAAAQKKYKHNTNSLNLLIPNDPPKPLLVVDDRHEEIEIDTQSSKEKRLRALRILSTMSNQIKVRK